MDDSTTQNTHSSAHTSPASAPRTPLGMSSFNSQQRQQFGQSIRLAMACIEGSTEPVATKAMPSNTTDIRQRLKVLSQDITSSQADLLELLVRFDDLQGWKSSGASHCAAWMNLEMSISLQLGWEYLRVGRKLRNLPTTTALFRAGKLSWSKVRLIVNVADKDTEKTLCHAALDGSVSEVKRLCDGYRWQDDNEVEGQENDRAVKQWQSRSLTWQQTSLGSTYIQLTLPPELAQAFLNSVEHSLNQLDEGDCCNEENTKTNDTNDTNVSQRRADAAVLMAETSLQQAGREIATADRYQVIVSVDATDVTASPQTQNKSQSQQLPSKRPWVKGAGPIARETARRLACDCSLSTHITSRSTTQGEPTDIGRKSRVWPSAMSRAIKERDQHCQFPGCTRTHHLQIHHITHWADGGSTSMANGVCLCCFHHTLVHEGGYTIEQAHGSELRMHEQFEQQRHADDASLFDVERNLRNNSDSFNIQRTLSPTRYRFRVINAQGVDVRVACHESMKNRHSPDISGFPGSYQPRHSTRVECREPEIPSYHYTIMDDQSDSIATELGIYSLLGSR